MGIDCKNMRRWLTGLLRAFQALAMTGNEGAAI